MATMEGPLSKWTNVMKGWQYRWFVLDDNAGLLSYYTSKEKMTRGVRRGCVRLKGAVIGIDDEDDSTFTITVDGKIFHFQASDTENREKWIRGLEDTILRHAQIWRWDPSKPAPTIQEFNKRLAEADAYLQLLIDQVKALDSRIEKCEEETAKAHCVAIKNRANEMLESIKHSIVLLQIAKNTAHPVNGIYQGPTNIPVDTLSSRSTPMKTPPNFTQSGAVSTPSCNIASPVAGSHVQTGIEVGTECQEKGKKVHNRASSTSSQVSQLSEDITPASNISTLSSVSAAPHRAEVPIPATVIVPETSYSSSEDEHFYDASEYTAVTTPTRSPSGPRLFEDAVEELTHAEAPAGKRPERDVTAEPTSNPVRTDGSIDYDVLYEDDTEESLGSMESHGTIISHLLSQVKIGMDLTRVVLPTFILERRSLLEMYADFFAHPDVFVCIPDFPEPRERMLQVLRWYLSSFHAGRKSSVAKKPYNPLLGETFRCHWDIPSSHKPSSQPGTVKDGPIPWCTKNQLTFLAEQVSHHPPISAFYAEHYNKRISFCAHIWTKSKFLGLSIGVHNIGQGCVSVLDYDEEYIVTFPNGYGRSILTVPWVELGGSVTITCAKTGYSANIEFITKPFYGGRKHRCLTEVFQPNDKKPFLSISGEWNGSMFVKGADGNPELFVDVNQLPITKKKVLPVSEQEEYESRRLWKDVTFGLRFNQIDKATAAKYALEQRQREEARERKEMGVAWETKLFHEVGENWVYDQPLQKRLTENCEGSTSRR